MKNEVIPKMWGYLDKRRTFHTTEEAARAANKKYEEIEALEGIKQDLEILLQNFNGHLDSWGRTSISSKLIERNSPVRERLEEIINKLNNIYV